MSSAPTLGSLETLSRLLRTRANRHAWIGLGVGLFAALAATLLHCRYETGSYTLTGMLWVQSQNPALWLLDLMPLAFLLWGQYIGMVMSYQASALVMDETRALREQASLLAHQLGDVTDTHGPRCHLPGRGQLLDGIRQALIRTPTGQGRLQVLALVSDRYAALAYGERSDGADRLVQQMALRLRHALGDHDLLTHLGHDRFAVLSPMTGDDTDSHRLARRLHLAFDTPVTLGDGPLGVSLHVGVAHGPRHGNQPESLLRNAEAACYLAQARGQETTVFDPEADQDASGDAHLLADLYGALHHDGLVDCYQLQRGIRGERRLRQQPQWPHPLRGTLSAHHFMDLPARATLLHQLTAWQLREAMHRLESLPPASRPHLVIRPPARAWDRLPLADMVLRLLQAHDRPAERLTLELPVALLVRESAALKQTLTTLAGAGVRLGMAGQSLLGTLPAAALVYPLHEARLPSVWLREIGRHERGAALLAQTLAQLHELGLQVTLGGADSAECLETASALGADYLEGRAIELPLSPTAVALSLETN